MKPSNLSPPPLFRGLGYARLGYAIGGDPLPVPSFANAQRHLDDKAPDLISRDHAL